jgi:putative nucleotidyltransferase with HDIG domain
MSDKSREEAWQVLAEYTKSDALLKHGLAVETALRAYARRYGEPEDAWGIAGMLHDFDYEMYPDINEHAIVGARILEERGFPENIIYAVKAHNDASGAPRIHLLDKVVFAVDELTGLITATALVRPTKSIYDVDAPSVRRKMKDKAFARNVSRDDILRGAADLGVDLDEHIAFVIRAMQEQAEALGLRGTGTG